MVLKPVNGYDRLAGVQDKPSVNPCSVTLFRLELK
jgi:hypothetical protein